jgi:hypothetical protein
MWSFSNVNPPPPDQKVVLEELIVGNVDLIVRLAVEVSHQYGYRGAWRFALVVSGLHGASSPKLLDRWGDERGPTYTDDSRSTEQTLNDLDASPDQTTSRLVMPLLRALDGTRARQVGQTTALKLGSRPTPVTDGQMVSGSWTTSPARGGSSVISWISQSFPTPRRIAA